MTSSGYDLRSPLEKVLEILADVRNAIDEGEIRMIQDMNYCIKMINTNKLYEAELDLMDPNNNMQSSERNGERNGPEDKIKEMNKKRR